MHLARLVEAAADPSISKLGTALPIAAALVFFLLSPLLTSKVKHVLAGQIATDGADHGVTSATPIPPHLTPAGIGDYVEYVADAVQIIPFALLPIFGAIFAISSNVPRILALAFLGFTVIVAVAMDAWLIACSAANYVSRKRFGYSLVTAVAIASNTLSLAAVLVFG